MIRTVWATCLLLLPGLLSAQSQTYVKIPAGDVTGLAQAIVAGNALPDGDTALIVVEGEYSFAGPASLPAIEGDIAIRGHAGPGIFNGHGGGPERLLTIAASAKLTLANIEFREFSLDHGGTGLIENSGELDVRKVQFSSVSSNQFCRAMGCSQVMPVLTNRSSGFIQMNQISIVDSGGTGVGGSGSVLFVNEGEMVMVNAQLYLPQKGWNTPFINSGSLTLASSSFKYDRGAAATPLRLLDVRDDGSTIVANSVFAGFSGDWCQQATSHGYNLIDAADCDWSEAGDLVGVSAGLLWRPVEARWSSSFQPEILTHALVPLAASAAVDSAGEAYCPTISLLSDSRTISDGNGDGQVGCDRGAIELTPIGLAEGGINGLWSIPEAGGHYVYILENDYNTLVVWNTFDPDGNPLWVYGIGELQNGRSLIAETYINRDGSVSLSGELAPAQDERWGTLEIDMTSCTEGTVGFYSDLPEFGSGQFSIERLAYVKQLGCTDL